MTGRFQDRVAITLTLDEWSWVCAALINNRQQSVANKVIDQVEEYFKGPKD